LSAQRNFRNQAMKPAGNITAQADISGSITEKEK
jgi:hypothetical protein